jgi:hypothetical protein
VLRAQMTARREAEAFRVYLADLQAAYGANAESAEWIEWIRDYIHKRDPLMQPPVMPNTPEPSRDDLKPFLPPGVSPYGPGHW